MVIRSVVVAAIVTVVLTITGQPIGASSLTYGSGSRHGPPGGQSCGDAGCVENFLADCAEAGGLSTATEVEGGGVELECTVRPDAKPWPGSQSCGDIDCVLDFIRACSDAGGKAVILAQKGGGYRVTCASI